MTSQPSKSCPACNQASPESASFCSYCGVDLRHADPVLVPEYMDPLLAPDSAAKATMRVANRADPVQPGPPVVPPPHVTRRVADTSLPEKSKPVEPLMQASATTQRVPTHFLPTNTTLRVVNSSKAAPRHGEEALEPPGGTTRRVSQNPSQTAPTANSAAHQVPSGQVPPPVSALGALQPGAVLCHDCAVVRTHHNHESARPGLFECDAPEGRVMVKVAATECPPQMQLWEKLPKLEHPHVLRTYRALTTGGYYYEVQEYCTGGTLEQYVGQLASRRAKPWLDWVENTLVPSFLRGISYLHSQAIVHRDIKPSNLYIREEGGKKSLVIGDFDISSVLTTGRTSRSTQRNAGTWLYSAPEAFPRFLDQGASQVGSAVAPASDYYSFGVVLLEMLMSTTALHQAQLPDLYDFYLQGNRVEVPEGLPPRLTKLLQGLLCRNRRLRWGQEELERWRTNSNTDQDEARIEADRGYVLGRANAAFSGFDHSKPTTLPQLSLAMAQEPAVALEELMTGEVLINWVGQMDARCARLLRKDRETWRKKPQMALLCARLRLDPQAAFHVGKHRLARTGEEWCKAAHAAIATSESKPEELVSEQYLEVLHQWLLLKAGPEPELAEKVAAIAAHHRSARVPGGGQKSEKPEKPLEPTAAAGTTAKTALNPLLVLEEIFWALQTQRPYQVSKTESAHSPAEIARSIMGGLEEWGPRPPGQYVGAFKRWQEGFLEAYLRQRLAPQQIKAASILQEMARVRNQFQDRPFVAFELALRLLDPSLPPTQMEIQAPESRYVLEGHPDGIVTLELPYVITGAGMPFGALRIESPVQALRVLEPEVQYRKGTVKLELDGRMDVAVRRQYIAQISLRSETTVLANEPVTVGFRVQYPLFNTVEKMVTCSVAGCFLAGLARTLLMPLAGTPIYIEEPFQLLVSNAGIFILLVLGLCSFIGLRLWFVALGRWAR